MYLYAKENCNLTIGKRLKKKQLGFNEYIHIHSEICVNFTEIKVFDGNYGHDVTRITPPQSILFLFHGNALAC